MAGAHAVELLRGGSPMTLRIDTKREGDVATIRVIGRMRAENLDDLRDQIREAQAARIVLDLDEVTLIDVDTVRFLMIAEREGTELRNCPPFIREWMSTEHDGGR